MFAAYTTDELIELRSTCSSIVVRDPDRKADRAADNRDSVLLLQYIELLQHIDEELSARQRAHDCARVAGL